MRLIDTDAVIASCPPGRLAPLLFQLGRTRGAFWGHPNGFAYNSALAGTIKAEVIGVPKRKKDRSKTGVSAPNVRGQGTTETETGAFALDSARKKTKMD
ncbi:hypothetical protein HNR34_003132 [Geobacillus subterraneus]